MRMERAPGAFRGRGHAAEVAAIGAERIWAVDAAASFSRPGPRLVEGTELLAHLLTRIGSRRPGVSFERGPVVAPAGRPRSERREMGLNWAEHTVEIAAADRTCFDGNHGL
jgi:hypothetical protein